ncbi:esterase [Aquabacterium olei]|uniref:Esterase n=1 Tax=Aquabacterium olei TaxID=1296669 RepID=A0A2U8FQ49_9BURK|nr:alpha/beta hydrolase [Aquabacterium olei]AWI53143.1 esterase [Aquabacterium olei]
MHSRRLAVPPRHRWLALAISWWIGLQALTAPAVAGPLRDLLHARQAARLDAAEQDMEEAPGTGRAFRGLPAGVKRLADQSYGPTAAHRYDVYLPQRPADAQPMPILFMVHGGGWARGDKAHAPVVENKVRHWVSHGVALVSVNYPMRPDTAPDQQAREVARALTAVQGRAASWGADPARVVLMGHSAGAHLVALLSARPERAQVEGARPWLGTVCLDSAAFDVVRIMEARHPGLYDRAFGPDRADWLAASPAHQLTRPVAPILAVCSARRAESCQQARDFSARVPAGAPQVQVLPVDLSHGEINATLGEPGTYTDAVDRFLGGLPGWRTPLSGGRPTH